MPRTKRSSRTGKENAKGGPRSKSRVPRRSNGNAIKDNRRRNTIRSDTFAGALFPELARLNSRFGVGVLLAVLERRGPEAELGFARVGRFYRTPGRRPKEAVLDAAEAGDVARILAGLAHPDRIRIIRAILQGASTHHVLHKTVNIKTGPLYHHLRALERAGVLTMATRNTYELTERGRIVLWVTNTLGAVCAGKKMGWSRRRWICRYDKKAS